MFVFFFVETCIKFDKSGHIWCLTLCQEALLNFRSLAALFGWQKNVSGNAGQRTLWIVFCVVYAESICETLSLVSIGILLCLLLKFGIWVQMLIPSLQYQVVWQVRKHTCKRRRWQLWLGGVRGDCREGDVWCGVLCETLVVVIIRSLCINERHIVLSYGTVHWCSRFTKQHWNIHNFSFTLIHKKTLTAMFTLEHTKWHSIYKKDWWTNEYCNNW